MVYERVTTPPHEEKGRPAEEKRPPPEEARTGMERLAEQLSEANRELESLSYTVSHDLRAPLRHIEAFAGLLEQNLAGKLDASSTEYLAVIGQSARQMSRLLDGVLSYSRVCRRELNRTNVSLDNALNAVLQELKLEMEGRKIDWTIESLPEIVADPWMMRQTFAQLVANALKFTRTRDPARISIGARTTGEEIVVRIEDNGVGFDPQYTGRLFGLFQRLHSDPRFEGSGIGLAHVRRMVQRHGGRVWAEARPDAGAIFFVALPRPITPGR
jgi:light-regulated signal transduction histidine kinase (bacteriophytochrome)